MKLSNSPRIAITGLARGENPQPGGALVRSIRRAWPNAYIVGLVYDAQESGIYADDKPDIVHTIPYPSSGKQALLDRIETILEISSFDILLPTLDAEIEPLIKMNDALIEMGITTIIPSLDSFQKRTKANLTELCKNADVRTPKTLTAQSASSAIEAAKEIGFPAFIKGPYYDAYRVYGSSDIIARANALLAEWGGPLLLQEEKLGSEFNIIGVGDGEGKILTKCSVRKTVVSSKGKGYGGVTVNDPKLNELCDKIISELQWFGPFELEFIREESTGDYYLLEINPRFPAWADVPALLGSNMAQTAILLATGQELETQGDCPVGQFFLRHNIDLVGSVNEFGQLMANGTLQTI